MFQMVLLSRTKNPNPKSQAVILRPFYSTAWLLELTLESNSGVGPITFPQCSVKLSSACTQFRSMHSLLLGVTSVYGGSIYKEVKTIDIASPERLSSGRNLIWLFGLLIYFLHASVTSCAILWLVGPHLPLQWVPIKLVLKTLNILTGVMCTF